MSVRKVIPLFTRVTLKVAANWLIIVMSGSVTHRKGLGAVVDTSVSRTR